MNMKTLNRIFFNIIILIFLQSCGYQPLLTSQNQKFSVKNINIYGDKKLARTLLHRHQSQARDCRNAKNHKDCGDHNKSFCNFLFFLFKTFKSS